MTQQTASLNASLGIHILTAAEIIQGPTSKLHIFSTGSVGALSRARSWLQDCLLEILSDSSCYETIPTRLLDTGPSETATLCLREKTQLNPNIKNQYLTLSHCWGDGRMQSKTMHRNIDRFRDRIEMAELSPLFQDVVQVVKFFAFRYIWIDSLCIIQDCKED